MRLLAIHLQTKIWLSLNKYEMLVLCVLLAHANSNNISFPSYTLLRIETKLMRKTISGALKGLELKGAIIVNRKKGTINKYDLSFWNNI